MQNDANVQTTTKRIRTTKYVVSVHFGTADKGSVKRKILRLIHADISSQSENLNRKKCG